MNSLSYVAKIALGNVAFEQTAEELFRTSEYATGIAFPVSASIVDEHGRASQNTEIPTCATDILLIQTGWGGQKNSKSRGEEER